MADTMQFDLVSPERRLASMQVTAVQIPGADGDMTAMPDHAPTITTLRPGVLRVEGPEGTAEYVVTGGFAEISSEGVSVLAERAVSKGDMTVKTKRFPTANHYVHQLENFQSSVTQGAAYPCPLEFSRGTQSTLDRIFEMAK